MGPHGAPLPTASSSTVRLRKRLPPEQRVEHDDQSDQSDSLQLVGQGSSLQRISMLSLGQAKPPAGGASCSRTMVRVPPPHVTEQAPAALQGDTAQSPKSWRPELRSSSLRRVPRAVLRRSSSSRALLHRSLNSFRAPCSNLLALTTCSRKAALALASLSNATDRAWRVLDEAFMRRSSSSRTTTPAMQSSEWFARLCRNLCFCLCMDAIALKSSPLDSREAPSFAPRR
mmetsp:Transcript_60040/g.130216  ORF Transcript_60040/g.130216 Transcript_60040/m.130216 type:complete len:229 (+) Transcript_60040:136-822(+)